MENLLIYLIIILLIIGLLVGITQFKSTKGWWGERSVRLILKFLSKDYRIYNDVRIYVNGRKCQIDHLILSRYGIFVIETKSYLGLISGKSLDKKWRRSVLGKRYFTGNPLMQNQYHIDLLTQKLRQVTGFNDQWLKSVIVFCFGSRLKISDHPDNVIMYYRLYRYIRKYKNEIISASVLNEITRKLF